MSYSSSSGGTCYEKPSLLETCQVRIFRLQFWPSFELGNQETHNKIERVHKGFEGLDPKAERTATLTPASCALLLLLLLLLLLAIFIFSK